MNEKQRNEPNAHTDEIVRRVIGAAIEVYRNLGSGFLESVYETALAIELNYRNIPFKRQYEMDVKYRDVIVGQGRLDFLIDGCLVVELKAIKAFDPIHYAQVISYLKATDCQLGLLINFNVQLLKSGLKRVIYS